MGDELKEEARRTTASRPAGWFRRGREQVLLARRLLKLGPGELLQAIEFDPSLRVVRLPVAQLLVRKAESTLEDPSRESEEAAELAIVIAEGLGGEEHDEARRTCAMASWLLGTAILRSLSSTGVAPKEEDAPGTGAAATGEPGAVPGPKDQTPKRIAANAAADRERLQKAAAVAFAQITAFVGVQTSWHTALSAVGLAQVRWLQGMHLSASALFAAAALKFARVDADEPVAACQVQHGFLLLGTGDRMLARVELAKAERRLDARRAPTLAVLTAIGIACCETANGCASDAAAHLAQARAHWRALPRNEGGGSAIPAVWREILERDENSSTTGELSDRTSLALLSGSPWGGAYPEAVVTLADRLLLGRAEDEPAVRVPAGRTRGNRR